MVTSLSLIPWNPLTVRQVGMVGHSKKSQAPEISWPQCLKLLSLPMQEFCLLLLNHLILQTFLFVIFTPSSTENEVKHLFGLPAQS